MLNSIPIPKKLYCYFCHLQHLFYLLVIGWSNCGFISKFVSYQNMERSSTTDHSQQLVRSCNTTGYQNYRECEDVRSSLICTTVKCLTSQMCRRVGKMLEPFPLWKIKVMMACLPDNRHNTLLISNATLNPFNQSHWLIHQFEISFVLQFCLCFSRFLLHSSLLLFFFLIC